MVKDEESEESPIHLLGFKPTSLSVGGVFAVGQPLNAIFHADINLPGLLCFKTFEIHRSSSERGKEKAED